MWSQVGTVWFVAVVVYIKYPCEDLTFVLNSIEHQADTRGELAIKFFRSEDARQMIADEIWQYDGRLGFSGRDQLEDTVDYVCERLVEVFQEKSRKKIVIPFSKPLSNAFRQMKRYVT